MTIMLKRLPYSSKNIHKVHGRNFLLSAIVSCLVSRIFDQEGGAWTREIKKGGEERDKDIEGIATIIE